MLHHVVKAALVTILACASITSTGVAALAQSSRPDRPITDKWALLVGVADFPVLDLENTSVDTSSGTPTLLLPARSDSLTYTVKDACDFRNFLVDKAGFAPSHVKVLLTSQATTGNIKYYLGKGWLGSVVKPDDLVLFYMSSHGSGDEYKNQSGDNYMVTYDYDPSDQGQTGLKMQDIGQLMKDSLKSDRVVVIADTCFSGNLKTRNFGDNLIGAGQIAVTACSADETSLDDQVRQGGLFTSYLLDSLKKHNGALKLAFDETQANVARASRLRLHEQHPTVNYSKWQGSDAVLFAQPTNPVP